MFVDELERITADFEITGSSNLTGTVQVVGVEGAVLHVRRLYTRDNLMQQGIVSLMEPAALEQLT